jgi:Uma2 family endonuclease
MGTKTLLTLEEFMALPDDGMRHELSEGELITMPPPAFLHSQVVRNIYRILTKYVDEKRIGGVFVDAGYLLSRAPRTVRQPDISYLIKDRLPSAMKSVYCEGAPELAVEVVSPTDSAAELNRKVQQYLEAGSKEVWVAYPDTRSVHVHRPGGNTYRAAETDTLTSDLFPGWSACVAEFFALD